MNDKERMKYINEELKAALHPSEEELKHQISRAADNMEIARLQAENKKLNRILEILKKNAYVYYDEIDIIITDEDEHFEEIREMVKNYEKNK